MNSSFARTPHFTTQSARDLREYLVASADAAQRALVAVQPERDSFLEVLRRFEKAVDAAAVEVEPSASKGVREATEAFRAQSDALRSRLDGLVERAAGDLENAYADLTRDAAFVTIMLFGRTRAGKSTTMEALTGGDGSSIGIGRQHTTKNVRAYYLPPCADDGTPDGPALRIVDTPGIEGFGGDTLAEMAEEFVERSDHIFFLLTNDKASSDELDRFGVIRTQGKSVTVLLNVKTLDENLDLLVKNPEFVFKKHEIEGHERRIAGYLERKFGMPKPRVLPIHARAGWLGRSAADLPDGVESRALLLKHSRLHDVVDRIGEFIRHEAVPARLCAPRDLLWGYLSPLKDELRPFAGQFRQIMTELERLVQRLEGGTERARRRVAARFPLLRARFQAASDDIPATVDAVIAAKGRGTALHTQWQQLLKRHGILDASTWFVEAGTRDFEAELAEEVRAATVDYKFANADLGSLLDEYDRVERGKNRNKYARMGVRSGAGAGAAALAWWAVLNWWNPTGWAAAAGLALTAGVGVAGEALARKATDEWERSSKRELSEKRAEIVARLRDRIWADQRCVRDRCGNWLDQTKALYLNVAHDVVQPIQVSARRLWQATVTCLRDLDVVASRVNTGLVADLLASIVPEYANGTIGLEAVAREPGFRTKAVVSGKPGIGFNAVAACIGRQGGRIRELCDALGGERVDIVDAHAPPEVKVLQALGLIRVDSATAWFNTKDSGTTAHVRPRDVAHGRAMLGPKGANVRLAAQLLGIKIIIEGGGS